MQIVTIGNQHLPGIRVVAAGNDDMPTEVIFLSAKIEIRQEAHVDLEHDGLPGCQQFEHGLAGLASAGGSMCFDPDPGALPGDHLHAWLWGNTSAQEGGLTFGLPVHEPNTLS